MHGFLALSMGGTFTAIPTLSRFVSPGFGSIFIPPFLNIYSLNIKNHIVIIIQSVEGYRSWEKKVCFFSDYASIYWLC